MKKYTQFTAVLAIALVVILSACANNVPPSAAPDTPTVAPTLTNTPDPCAPENIQAEVNNVHKYMREFDDASALAASRPRDQLPDAIADLQRIRREAEDQVTPSCLGQLKTYQISHMNSVINTLIAFMGGSDQKIVQQGIDLARAQHDQYTLELARLLGLTVEPAAVLPIPTETPTP